MNLHEVRPPEPDLVRYMRTQFTNCDWWMDGTAIKYQFHDAPTPRTLTRVNVIHYTGRMQAAERVAAGRNNV